MIWLLAAALLAGAPPQRLAPPSDRSQSIDVWEVDDGLPQNSVISMMQTRDGYLWLGTWAGLVRFDGVRFVPVATDLTDSHIMALVEDTDGAVWIATGGGVARWVNGDLKTFTHADGLSSDSTTRLIIDNEGRLWVGTLNGVSVVERGVIRAVRPSGAGWPSPRISALARAGDGRILIGTDAGICTATGLTIVCPVSPPPPPSTITGLAVDSMGRLLVATAGDGLVEWTGDRYVPGPCDAPVCRGVGDIRALMIGADGEVLVGLVKGLVSFNASGASRTLAGLPAAAVRVFLRDLEGSLWIGTDGGGLARFRPTRVATYGVEEGLPAPVTASIVQDSAGQIWAGSRCGPLVKFEPSGRFTPAPPALRTRCALAVLAARDGSLWLGGPPRGVVRAKGGTVRRIDLVDGPSQDEVRALYEDRSGAIWVALDKSPRLYRIAGDRIDSFGREDGVEGGVVSAFAETPDGRLFVGSNAYGLMVFDGTRFARVDAEGPLPSRMISSLLVDTRRELWIGTSNQGLFRMRAGRFEHFSVAHGLPDPVVALMLEDDEANLWVATSRGISRLSRARIEDVASGVAKSLEPIVLGKADGLRALEGSGGGFDPSGLKDREGRLWFSTLAGIAVIDPDRIPINTVPPPVVVEHAILDETDLRRPRDAVVEVPAGTQSVEIAYTAFSLLEPRRVRFRYRLENFDAMWHEAGSRRSAFYTNLPPATYRFQVMAANNDGIWSEQPATLSLVVLPQWWQRRPVQFAGLALLLLLTGTGARAAAVRRARERVAELEREQALDRERRRIARDLHDDIGTRLTHLALLADDSETPDVRRQLSETARDTAHTMDELVWSVNAANDTVEGLATYVMRFAETHGRAAGLRCRFQAPDTLEGQLAANTRRHLFLAIKEAVNNAVKHAEAGELRLRLVVEDGTLTFEVSDDGRGMAGHAGDPTGNGLANMRERMHAVGGTVAFERPSGGGTTVRFSVRLQDA
jgi:ligand-binding sensor domain-containing protein/signal transduction histidine kinase